MDVKLCKCKNSHRILAEIYIDVFDILRNKKKQTQFFFVHLFVFSSFHYTIIFNERRTRQFSQMLRLINFKFSTMVNSISRNAYTKIFISVMIFCCCSILFCFHRTTFHLMNFTMVK